MMYIIFLSLSEQSHVHKTLVAIWFIQLIQLLQNQLIDNINDKFE